MLLVSIWHIRNQFPTISLLALFITNVQNIEMIVYAGALENLKAQKHICKQCGLPMNELLCNVIPLCSTNSCINNFFRKFLKYQEQHFIKYVPNKYR
ncbi:hypothetical protein D917_04958 [Trichinella nativa]|uniref:Uncharacterized protein n=1 Tax=Trichinella nativa TaxID=6335 RepID=A0A1Y3EXJ7_9BILA|nr:hypothetical protein D917_04958 [Trichinella nativa]